MHLMNVTICNYRQFFVGQKMDSECDRLLLPTLMDLLMNSNAAEDADYYPSATTSGLSPFSLLIISIPSQCNGHCTGRL